MFSSQDGKKIHRYDQGFCREIHDSSTHIFNQIMELEFPAVHALSHPSEGGQLWRMENFT